MVRRLRLFCPITCKLISCAASCRLTAVRREISDFPSVCKERYHHATQSRTAEGYLADYDKTPERGFLPYYCWFSHDVTKIQTKKLSILARFYFHDALEQLKTNFHTNFRFKGVLGFVIEYA